MKGYKIVFSITLSIFLLLVLISTMLKCKNYGSNLDFKKVFSNKEKEWNIIRKSTFSLGLRDMTICFLINILIIETTGSELSLGKLALVGSLLASVAYILVQKIIKPPHRKLSINIGVIGSALAVVGLLVNIEYKTLLAYTIMDGFFLPFFLIQLNSATFNVVNHAHQEKMRIEYLINKDIALNSGRIISAIILLILISIFKNTSMLKFYLVFIGLAPIVSGHFLRKLSKVLEGKVS
jgi:YQGE family putative transporter